eukprot:scaffold7450_cov76-Phaeocystis_antarctica.AAC.4
MPPRAITRSKNTLADTYAQAASPQRTHRKRCLGRQHHLNPAVCEARPPAKRYAEASSETDGAPDLDWWCRPDGEGELEIEYLLLNRREERLTARDSEVR